MVLLDTHTFVWLASDLSKIPKAARHAIRANAHALFVSGITGLEVALAAKRGRLVLPMEPAEFIARAMAHHGIQQIPVTAAIGCRAANLPDLHNDPFDRIIVATANLHHMNIITKDSVIPTYPDVTVTWS